MAAPTLISYTESTWTAGATTKTLASISWQTGDVIVVIAGNEANDAWTLPTVAGLTFTTQKTNTAASTCSSLVSAAVAASSSSGTISMGDPTNPASHWGFAAWVWRGSQGIGNSAEQHTSTKTVALTPTAAHGAIVCGVFDFSATAITGISITPTPTNTRQRVADGASYALYVSDLADQSSAGATSYGISGGSGTGPFSIVALEIKAGASAAGNVPSPFIVKQAVNRAATY